MLHNQSFQLTVWQYICVPQLNSVLELTKQLKFDVETRYSINKENNATQI